MRGRFWPVGVFTVWLVTVITAHVQRAAVNGVSQGSGASSSTCNEGVASVGSARGSSRGLLRRWVFGHILVCEDMQRTIWRSNPATAPA